MILAATGHRPEKLGGYGESVAARLRRGATRYLKTQIGVEQVISGMALGWDTAWALAATDLGIPFIAAIPFAGQECRWPTESQERYWALLKKSARVVIVNDGGYHPAKMQSRNCWMVEHSDKLVALWDGSSGGTANCVKWAETIGKPVENLWPHFARSHTPP